MKKPQPKKPNKELSYEQLGKMMENIYQSGYIDKNQLYKTTFFKGVVAGFGGVIGATVVVAIIIWILSLFSYTPLEPLVEPFTDALKSSVNTEK